jgi:hypothetical protein
MSLTLHFEPSPRTRAFVTGIALVGVLASSSFKSLTIILLFCVGTLLAQGKILPFTRFLLRVWIPLALGLFFVWGFLVQGSPQTGNGSGAADGVKFAAIVSLRIASLAALFQTAVLSLVGLRLVRFLKSLGLSSVTTATIVSIFNLWPDFARRSEQVVAARCARGLMSDRHLWTRVRQIPWTVRTLFIGALGHSLERAARWEAESLPDRLAEASETVAHAKTSRWVNASWLVAAFTWTILALWTV